jgi:ribosomal protein S18 acetylase RimI-like enzyme
MGGGSRVTAEIRYADRGDLTYLERNDSHIAPDVLRDKVARREVIVVRVDGQVVGWLRYGYWWDLVPFMNMLAVDEEERRKGYGSSMIAFWEAAMRQQGCEYVMTSTQADEQAQHLYRRLGYRDCGSLLFPGQTPLEVLLIKPLSADN